ncbi:MAG TPA: hypothetical protein VGV35_10425 [Bryobacteraceae bacterium]|nr:hypothetical protein [Bryobacteraceae bacterium]
MKMPDVRSVGAWGGGSVVVMVIVRALITGGWCAFVCATRGALHFFSSEMRSAT